MWWTHQCLWVDTLAVVWWGGVSARFFLFMTLGLRWWYSEAWVLIYKAIMRYCNMEYMIRQHGCHGNNWTTRRYAYSRVANSRTRQASSTENYRRRCLPPLGPHHYGLSSTNIITLWLLFFLVFAYNSIIALCLHSSVCTYHALCILLLRCLLSFIISHPPSPTSSSCNHSHPTYYSLLQLHLERCRFTCTQKLTYS